MAITARMVRRLLLATTLALLLVILGFAGYAHYRARLMLRALPRKLGVDIKQETNAFTYSQSVGGRTVFTVHASKEIQRINGRVTLHDVAITLYGRTPDSADRIRGSEFEYDPGKGILTAAGEVYLDLQAPAGALPSAEGAAAESRMIHVKTSGLIFVEKQRSASTDEPIEFEAGGLRGRAVGATYDSAAGLVVLQHDVNLSGVHDGRPTTLTAAHAELDRNRNRLLLAEATAAVMTASGEQKLSAQQTVVNLTSDGAPETLMAEGHVLLARGGGVKLSGDRLTANFAEAADSHQSLLREAHLEGDVRFRQDPFNAAEQGTMHGLDVRFDRAGHARDADLQGGVDLSARASKFERTLTARTVHLELGTDADGRTVLHRAQALGDGSAPARIRLLAAEAKGNGTAVTQVSAQRLLGEFVAAGKTTSLKTLEGEGRTALERSEMGSTGAMVTRSQSTGDSLRAVFRASDQGQMLLEQAEQHGHVIGTREVAAHTAQGRKVPAEAERARCDSAAYDAAADRLLLRGSVSIANATSSLLADEATLDRKSGVASARGAVRVTYQQAGASSGEPLHVSAERAVATRSTGLTQFFGGGQGSGPARMWQGGSQVQAAEIDVDRKQRQVAAKGNGGRVVALLAGAGAGGGLARVSSRKLIYTEGKAQIELNGLVKFSQGESRMQSAHALVFLTRAAPAQTAAPGQESGAAAGLMGGKVDRMVAEGDVQLMQPGRRASGERLTYTAQDATYTLTGTRAAPPRVVDDARGTITGSALRFNGRDDSVEVLSADGERVQTTTRVSPARKGK